MSAVEFWKGEFGDEYQTRNASSDIEARVMLWREIVKLLRPTPLSILEVGAGSGANLEALYRVDRPGRKYPCKNHWPPVWFKTISAVEPNATARAMLERPPFNANAGFRVYDGTAANPGRTADLVFTSGVLIHIPPDELLAACRGIYNASTRYIVCIEYFADEPEEKLYRGHAGKLWKRDFGAFWLDNFKLKTLGCGFAWKRTTGGFSPSPFIQVRPKRSASAR